MGDASFPRGPEDITAEWLSDRIGTAVSAFETEQIGIGVGLLGRLYRVTLTAEGSAPASVIAKFPTLDETARMNVVEPLRFYEKEVRFYQGSAQELPVATPLVYFADFDPATGDFALLLEDLCEGRMADQVAGCHVTDAETAVDAMAELHAYSWGGSRFADMPWLPTYSDPPFPQVIAGMYKQAWPAAREVMGDRMPEKIRDYGDRYEELVPWFMEELGHEPLTFCHGDFRLDNLFFGPMSEAHRTERGGSGGRSAPGKRNGKPPVTIVDWQICFRGRAGYDLAYFVSQSLKAEDRRSCEESLIERYVSKLAERGIQYPRDELVKDYKRTVAYCFIYPIVAVGQIELTNERHLQLLHGMLDRAVEAIEDTGALKILPG